MIYQSPVHGAHYGGDTLTELDELIEQKYQKYLSAKTRNGKTSLTDWDKQKAYRERQRIETKYKKYYTPWDEQDPEGNLWLKDDASALHIAIAEGYREISRLTGYLLSEQPDTDWTEPQQLPGTVYKLPANPTLNTEDRQVYRTSSGNLISAEQGSRYVIHHGLH